MGMDVVESEWNGVQFNYEVDYKELNPRTSFKRGCTLPKCKYLGCMLVHTI